MRSPLIPLLLLTALLASATPAAALDPDRTGRLIDDAFWTYDETWVVYDRVGDDTFALVDAFAYPFVNASDATWLRVWPVATAPALWALASVDCGEHAFGLDADAFADCSVESALGVPVPGSSVVVLVVTRAPGEFSTAAQRSLADGPSATFVLVDGASEEADLIATRWTTDVLALLG